MGPLMAQDRPFMLLKKKVPSVFSSSKAQLR